MINDLCPLMARQEKKELAEVCLNCPYDVCLMECGRQGERVATIDRQIMKEHDKGMEPAEIAKLLGLSIRRVIKVIGGIK